MSCFSNACPEPSSRCSVLPCPGVPTSLSACRPARLEEPAALPVLSRTRGAIAVVLFMTLLGVQGAETPKQRPSLTALQALSPPPRVTVQRTSISNGWMLAAPGGDLARVAGPRHGGVGVLSRIECAEGGSSPLDRQHQRFGTHPGEDGCGAGSDGDSDRYTSRIVERFQPEHSLGCRNGDQSFSAQERILQGRREH